MEIVIDWQEITSEEEFFAVFLPQVNAPEWHGRNLNALGDSIVTGDVNAIEPPYTIHSINTAKVPMFLSDFQRRVLDLFNEAVAASRSIRVVTE